MRLKDKVIATMGLRAPGCAIVVAVEKGVNDVAVDCVADRVSTGEGIATRCRFTRCRGVYHVCSGRQGLGV